MPNTYRTQDGIVINNVPDGTPEEEIKARIESIRAERDGTQPPAVPSVSEIQQNSIDDMGPWERRRAGAGQFFEDKLTGIKQMGSLFLTGAGYPQLSMRQDESGDLQLRDWVPTVSDVDRMREESAPLMNTPEGKQGYFGAGITTAAGTSVIPGANTLPGAGITGGLWGLTEPMGTGDDPIRRAKQGWSLGVGGQALGNALGRYFSGRSANRQAMQRANSAADEILDSSIDSGYSVPPSLANRSSSWKRLVESLSGKYKTNQAARLRNQPVTNRLASQALGLPDDVPITIESLAEVRRGAFTNGYGPVRRAGQIVADDQYLDDISKLSSGNPSFPETVDDVAREWVEKISKESFDSGDAVDLVRQLRDKASTAYRQGDNGLGGSFRDMANAVESQIERHLTNMGEDGAKMLDEFRFSRQLIAKSHSVEQALNPATGNVDAVQLANQLRRGSPLSGELRDVADFASAYRDAAKVPATGDSNAYSVLDAMGIAGSLGSGNAPLAAAIASRPAARSALLSRPMQRSLQHPIYDYSPLVQLLGQSTQRGVQAAPIAALPAVTN